MPAKIVQSVNHSVWVPAGEALLAAPRLSEAQRNDLLLALKEVDGLEDSLRLLCESEQEAKDLVKTINDGKIKTVTVQSHTDYAKTYEVTIEDGAVSDCTCPSRLHRQGYPCKHMFAVSESMNLPLEMTQG